MATFQKRGNSWRAIVRKTGATLKAESATFPTKAEAQAWANKIEGDIITGKHAAIPDKTFGELLLLYAETVSIKKKGERWERVRINKFLRDDIAKIKLASLCAADFAEWRDRSLKTMAGSSVKRERNLLSNVLQIAIHELGWLKESPLRGVKMPQSARARDRILSELDIETLLFTLGYHADSAPLTVGARIGAAMLFAIETGMRAGEICALKEGDLVISKSYCRVTGQEIGAGKTESARRDVPLSAEAKRILEQMIEVDKGDSVFNLKTSQIDSNFRKAKANALIDDLHFHDTRATACTRLSKKLDILSLARMLGHKDLRMLQVYYRESAEDMAKNL